MDKSEQLKFRHDLGVFAQSLAFYIFGTAGMLAIASALLAGPIVRYYHDQRAIEVQQYKLVKLTEQQNQQQELLSQLDNEAIVKRAAKMTLNYVTSSDDLFTEQIESVQRKWPDLTDAVLRACDDFPQEQAHSTWLNYCEIMAARPHERTALLCVGGGLLAVCLTCFATSRHC